MTGLAHPSVRPWCVADDMASFVRWHTNEILLSLVHRSLVETRQRFVDVRQILKGDTAYQAAPCPRPTEALTAGDSGNRTRRRSPCRQVASQVFQVSFRRLTSCRHLPDTNSEVERPAGLRAFIPADCPRQRDILHGAAVAWGTGVLISRLLCRRLESPLDGGVR
jgi:hypothetical protein